MCVGVCVHTCVHVGKVERVCSQVARCTHVYKSTYCILDVMNSG